MTTDTALIVAESHLATYDYAGNRPALLLYFRGLLDAAGKTSAKADAVQAWVNSLVFTAATAPDQLDGALVSPPFPFREVASEAVAALQS